MDKLENKVEFEIFEYDKNKLDKTQSKGKNVIEKRCIINYSGIYNSYNDK